MASSEIQFRINADKKEQFKKVCGDKEMSAVLKEFIDQYIKENAKGD